MKKVVRLTESDLNRIVRRVITESIDNVIVEFNDDNGWDDLWKQVNSLRKKNIEEGIWKTRNTSKGVYLDFYSNDRLVGSTFWGSELYVRPMLGNNTQGKFVIETQVDLSDEGPGYKLTPNKLYLQK